MSTNELEKQFFDIFGIEPKSVKLTLKLAMPGYDESDLPEDLRQFISSQAQVYRVYPQITDHILLELICLFATDVDYYTCCPSNIEALKEDILRKSIIHNKLLDKHKVRALFEGGNNG